ncbi:kelch-like protein 25 [Lineus longissimus]|uniref:kelch-like protein 25 n=1 Tax=Lineus longissimus TaxID=88925 RepID=UPI002B4FA5CF
MECWESGSESEDGNQLPLDVEHYSRKVRMYRIEQLFKGKGLNMDKMAASVPTTPTAAKTSIATLYGPMDGLAPRRHGVDSNRFILIFSRNSGDIRVTYLMVEKAHLTVLPRVLTTDWVKLRGVVGYRALACDNSVYVVGGRRQDSGYLINRVIRYDPMTQRWKTCSGMNYARANFAISVMGRTKILVAGGVVPNEEDRAETLTNTAEIYDPYLDKWTLMPEMKHSFKDSACVSRDFEVFICGGTRDKDTPGTKSSMVFRRQKLDDKINSDHPFQCKDLTERVPLPKMLAKHSMTRLGNAMYLIGGLAREGRTIPEEPPTDHEPPLDEVAERLETSPGVYCHRSRSRSSARTNILASRENWHTCPEMKQPRCEAGLVATGNRIYVIGGHDHTHPDKSILEVDSYHVIKEKWQTAFTLDERSYTSVDCCMIDVPVTNTAFKCEAFTGTCKWVMW